MINPVEQALAFLRGRSALSVGRVSSSITLNFHPDILIGGRTMLDLLAESGTYRSQFETGTSNGGLTAIPGGDRWNWESQIFGGAYDKEHPSHRPKYGALNHRHDPVGGSRRFGSCHFRVAPHVHSRTSYCYPDSHLQPRDFAVGNPGQLIPLAEKNELHLDLWLDNYIEAHIHGPLSIVEDIDALVLDPCYQGTNIERFADRLGCPLEWHKGFKLLQARIVDCKTYRGPIAADAVVRILEDKVVTPAILGRARESLLDYQTAKWVWHCIARFGLE